MLIARNASGSYLATDRATYKSDTGHRAVEVVIFEYVNGFYNPRRRHSALGWKAPWLLKE